VKKTGPRRCCLRAGRPSIQDKEFVLRGVDLNKSGSERRALAPGGVLVRKKMTHVPKNVRGKHVPTVGGPPLEEDYEKMWWR